MGDYVCSYCLIDAHDKCPAGQGCRCECRTGKPLVSRLASTKASRAGQPPYKVVEKRETARKIGAGPAPLSSERQSFDCDVAGCERVFATEQGMRVHKSRSHYREVARAAAPELDALNPDVVPQPGDPTPAPVPPREMQRGRLLDQADEVVPDVDRPSPEPSQHVLDVADSLAFLDRADPLQLLIDVLESWAAEQLARDDVETIVRILERRREASVS